MTNLLRVADLGAEELTDLLQLAARFKRDPAPFADTARGSVVAVLFEKPSLRTRFSVEVALHRIGAQPIGAYDLAAGFGTREPISDGGRVLARYADGIVMRTSAHERLDELAEVVDVPVVNALSDTHHPLQALADLQTLAEAGEGRLEGAKLAYVGDGNNVAHSLIEACGLAQVEIALGCPAGYEPDPGIVTWAQDAGGSVKVTDDPHAAVRGASAVYTDVWASMGWEGEAAERREIFEPYRVTAELMQTAAPGAIFLHCLPAHRGDEVTAEVIDGPASRVFDQAENRLHTAAAVFIRLFGKES